MSDVKIEIGAQDNTKGTWDDVVKTAQQGAEKVEQSSEHAAHSAADTADHLGHTGEVAAKMAINLAQAFGFEGEQAKQFVEVMRQLDDGFDAIGKAAHLFTVAQSGVAVANTATTTTAAGATVATNTLTAAMLANPATAILVGIAAAAAAVTLAFSMWPKSGEDIEDVTGKLKDQKSAVDALVDAVKKRLDASTSLRDIEAAAAQAEKLKSIREIESVDKARELYIAAAKQADLEKSRAQVQEDEVRKLAELLTLRREQQKTLDKDLDNLEARNNNLREIGVLELEIEKLVSNRVNHEKRAAEFIGQAQAARERIAAIPDEQLKKREEALKDMHERDEKMFAAAKKADEDRLKAAEEYADIVNAMNAENKKAREEEAKVLADKKKEELKFKEDLKKKDKEAAEDVKDEVTSGFDGLEELTKRIQASAAGMSEGDKMKEAAVVIKDAAVVMKGAGDLGIKLKGIDDRDLGEMKDIADKGIRRPDIAKEKDFGFDIEGDVADRPRMRDESGRKRPPEDRAISDGINMESRDTLKNIASILDTKLDMVAAAAREAGRYA